MENRFYMVDEGQKLQYLNEKKRGICNIIKFCPPQKKMNWLLSCYSEQNPVCIENSNLLIRGYRVSTGRLMRIKVIIIHIHSLNQITTGRLKYLSFPLDNE